MYRIKTDRWSCWFIFWGRISSCTAGKRWAPTALFPTGFGRATPSGSPGSASPSWMESRNPGESGQHIQRWSSSLRRRRRLSEVIIEKDSSVFNPYSSSVMLLCTHHLRCGDFQNLQNKLQLFINHFKLLSQTPTKSKPITGRWRAVTPSQAESCNIQHYRH